MLGVVSSLFLTLSFGHFAKSSKSQMAYGFYVNSVVELLPHNMNLC